MKNKSQVTFASAYVLISAIGCIWSFFNDDRFPLYFTNLSNYFCFIVMLIELIRLLLRRQLTKPLQIIDFCAMMSLMITGIVYNTLLKTPFEDGYWTNYHSMIMHLICPSMIIIYFFKYRLGSNLGFKYLWWCVVPPYAYMIFIFSRQWIIPDNWYPYFFLDPNKQGASGVWEWIAMLTVVFLILGAASLLLAQKMKHKISA